MSSSSGDEYTGYRKSFPLHDAIEAGSMDLISRIIHNSNSNHGCGMDVDDADGNSGKVLRDNTTWEGQKCGPILMVILTFAWFRCGATVLGETLA